MGEIADDRGALRRVHHFRVEHQPIEPARCVGDGGKGRVGGGADHLKTIGDAGDAVAMAHPDPQRRSRLRDAVEQLRRRDDIEIGAAEFPLAGRRDLAAELGDHGLLAIADAKHRHAGGKNALRCARRVGVDDARRAARKDDRARLQPIEGFIGMLKGNDFRIDAGFAHAASDKLSNLAAEIDDKDGVRHGCG